MIVVRRPYGLAAKPIPFDLYAIDDDELDDTTAIVAGDATVVTDQGTSGNADNLPSLANGVREWAPSAAELTGEYAKCKLEDQGTKAWADDSIVVETTDHPSAMHPNGCIYQFTAASFSGANILATSGSDGVDYPAAAEEAVIANNGYVAYVASATLGAGQAMPLTAFDYTGGTGELQYTLLKAFNLTPTGTVVIKVYEGARTPAHIIDKLSTVALSTQEKLDANSEADTAITDNLTISGGIVDANVQQVNDVTIVGDGSATPFQV